MKLGILSTDFRRILNENSSSGRRVVPCVRTDGRSDVMKLIVAFRNFLKVLKYSHNLLKFSVSQIIAKALTSCADAENVNESLKRK